MGGLWAQCLLIAQKHALHLAFMPGGLLLHPEAGSLPAWSLWVAETLHST